MKLRIERQRLIICVNLGMFNYCFIRVSDYTLVFVMVCVSRFERYSVRNAVAGCKWVGWPPPMQNPGYATAAS